jgi:hypothetical protein
MVRKANPPITTIGTNRMSTGLPRTSTLPSPTVNQTRTAKNPNSVIAIQNFRFKSESELCNPSRIPTLNSWCTGEDSNLRSSKERQIYSLLPLTARPPVPNHPATKSCHCGSKSVCPSDNVHRSRANVKSMTFSALSPARRFSGSSEYAPLWGHQGGQPGAKNMAAGQISKSHFFLSQRPYSGSSKWSWRRDLNPRPSDYKSDALPAELRQPLPPGKHTENSSETNSTIPNAHGHTPTPHTTAQRTRLAHPRQRSKPVGETEM